MLKNLILNSDSYKYSHFLQYPPGTTHTSAYIESRWGESDEVVFFGLQVFLNEYLNKKFSGFDIAEAKSLITAHGLPFNEEGFHDILKYHGGLFPVEIQAVPEGTIIGLNQVQLQIKNTDPRFPWLPTFLETALLRAIWYPSTVATLSRNVKKTIWQYLKETCDDPESQIDFKLHDFGARGASSEETAMLGGMAHLVNFKGTDTVSALVGARQYYQESMAGFSIPASEHSTITAWGKEHELDAFRNMIVSFGKKDNLVACVSDSYDIYEACNKLWGEALKEQIKDIGCTLVVRPDSGDPVEVTLKVIEILGEKFGYSTNQKSYKVLSPFVRIIQGDGVNPNSIKAILENYKQHGWSAENIAFGMGAALLQKVNRDTFGYAMKVNAIKKNDGDWLPISKNPVTDSSKASKAGRLALERRGDVLQTIPEENLSAMNEMRVVWRVTENKRIFVQEAFPPIRMRAAV